MLFRDEDEDEELLPFANRAEAGRILAMKLLAYSGREDVVVLGLPRGGVPVAFEVARVLNVPLDVLVVRKLGTPWNRELAMGAIAPNDVQVLDMSLAQHLCVSDDAIKKVVATERDELKRQERLYRGDRPALLLAEKTVILVDDGIATGSCILAAIGAVRKQSAKQVIVAVPVAAAAACSALRIHADEVISLAEPEMFLAISQWYEEFGQVCDEDVTALLESGAISQPRAA